MTGIVSYGVYIPHARLDRRSIGGALGGRSGSGTRAIAGYDEDSTSMGVEAGRRALAGHVGEPATLSFATTVPAYLDKTNATTIHAALGLSPTIAALDCIGSPRSAIAAWMLASATGGMAILSDIRIGRPSSADESSGGDAAVAVIFGDDDQAIAIEVASAFETAEFLDRWRVPGEHFSRQWEERFGEHAYGPLVARCVKDACGRAGLEAADIDHVVITGMHTRAVAAARRSIGVRTEALAEDFAATIGNTGTAHAALMLADVLDRAEPGQTILVVTLADGCSAQVLRATDAIVARRPARTVRDLVAGPTTNVSYADYLTWRGLLDREPPRRPEPDQPAAPPSLRASAWKFGLVASVDEGGVVHVPPVRVSMTSGSIDEMTTVRMADVPATVATFSVDRLAYSLSPPVVAAVLDFDGGGRFECELTEVDPDTVRVGDRVEMTFRRLFTQNGVHNYFWKARPLRAS